MNVKELIELLREFPQDLPVVYGLYSEYCLLEAKDIEVMKACIPRGDGWVHSKRPDKPSCKYLRFPGN